jgi:hypothetical protein
MIKKEVVHEFLTEHELGLLATKKLLPQND